MPLPEVLSSSKYSVSMSTSKLSASHSEVLPVVLPALPKRGNKLSRDCAILSERDASVRNELTQQRALLVRTLPVRHVEMFAMKAEWHSRVALIEGAGSVEFRWGFSSMGVMSARRWSQDLLQVGQIGDSADFHLPGALLAVSTLRELSEIVMAACLTSNKGVLDVLWCHGTGSNNKHGFHLTRLRRANRCIGNKVSSVFCVRSRTPC